MKTIELLSYLRSLDVKLWADGDRLRYSAPKGALTAALRTELAAHKPEILAFLHKAQRATHATLPPISPAPRSADLPLSFAQQRLWFLAQLEPESAAYNIPAAYRLRGPLNVTALEQSLSDIVRRHESLRTTFYAVDGHPAQVVAPHRPLALPMVDLRGVPAGEQEARARQLATEHAQRPFDLAQGPLFRATLARLTEEDHVLLLNTHHIVSDGWSTGVLISELVALYKAFATGTPSLLPELALQYADYAVWQREWLQGEVLEAQLAYWRQQLRGSLPVLDLPTDRPRPAIQTYQGARQSLLLPKPLSDALKALSRREGVTLFMTLLAAFQVLLRRYTGQQDIAVGSPIAGRTRAELEGLIGLFVNTLVLRTDLSGNPTFRELLQRMREVALGAYAHQELPFERLVEALQPERSLSHTPLFQVFFNMLNLQDTRIALPGLAVEVLSSHEVESKFDLTLYVREQNQSIQFDLVYNADLFGLTRMVEMLAQLNQLLVQIVENPEERITQFSLVTPAAAALLPNPAQALGSGWAGAVHTRFSQQAHRVPARPAVVDPGEVWSYAELEARSNQLAHYLCASGIQPQEVVVIYGHRSASFVWALIGVLKAGAAFLILDPAYPASRLIDCLGLAKPRGWIQIGAAGALPEALEEVVATLSWRCRLELPHRTAAEAYGLLQGYSTDDPGVMVGPDDLAYIVFTSGSTGKPKGVLGEHRPISHFLDWYSQTFGLSESDRFSLLSGLSHDPLLRDLFTPLWLGSTLYIPDPEHLWAPDQLCGWMQQQELSIVHLTPALGQLLTAGPSSTAAATSGDTPLRSLRYACFGGDVLTTRDVSKLRALAPSATCVNFYGTTETPQAMGFFIIPNAKEGGQSHGPRQEEVRGRVPVGRGIADVQLVVLNDARQLVGIGEVGEIYVRTPYLTKGYIDDEALTQERFIPNPLTTSPGDRLYKTGDLARYLPDGNVEFLGRNDDQVKLRGFRIELGEIEAVLRQHPAVQEAVVIAREDTPGEKRLVAYVVADQQPGPGSSDLRRFLQAKLPDYMVPAAFVRLDALPLTPNGKVDRRALPAPEGLRPELEAAYVAPTTEVERSIAAVWREVLGIDQVGIHDNFFNLGGHSLMALQVLSRLRRALRVELSVRVLFEAPTVAGLALAVRQNQGECKGSYMSITKRIKGGNAEQLLANLDQLSDKEVDSLLGDVLTEERLNE
jgi:amino acid adenylation domain-containing protein